MSKVKEPIDFLKVIEGVKATKEEETKEAFKQLRFMYLELLNADFTLEEAMAFLAALIKAGADEKKS